jgi:two-component system sensor histidine kinase KdpD
VSSALSWTWEEALRTSKDDNPYQTFLVRVLSKVARLLSAHALSVLRVFAGMIAIVLLTYCGYHLHLNLASENSLYLLVVVLVSLFGGFWEATLTSVAAAACLTYFFIPPSFTFNITDGGNFVSVVAFEATAVIVGRLATKVKQQAQDACQRESNTQRLCDLSRRILLLNRQQNIGVQIATAIAETFRAEAVALFNAASASEDVAGPSFEKVETLARETYLLDSGSSDLPAGLWRRPLRLGSNSVGAIVLLGPGLNPVLVDAVASLAAIALERARSLDKETRADAARRAEELRTAVLDALAHAFKTPLTAIRTASSGLLEMGSLPDPTTWELVSLIDDQAERLNLLASRLLQMAKLDSAQIRLQPSAVPISPMLRQILAEHASALANHAVTVLVPDAGLAVDADRDLVKMAMKQFVDNAAKYSTTGSPIQISAREIGTEMVFSVHNFGPFIRVSERERVFERFYRSPEMRRGVAGTGLGLSVAKKIVEAHCGRIWVTSDEVAGTTFYLALPRISRHPDGNAFVA